MIRFLISLFLAFSVVSGGQGQRISERGLVLMLLNTKTVRATIKADVLVIYSFVERVDTLNMIECADIAGCKAVKFMNKNGKTAGRIVSGGS